MTTSRGGLGGETELSLQGQSHASPNYLWMNGSHNRYPT